MRFRIVTSDGGSPGGYVVEGWVALQAEIERLERETKKWVIVKG